jgi:hypothetical protein
VQASGHAKMDQQMFRAGQVKNNVLAPATDVCHLFVFYPHTEDVGRRFKNRTRPKDLSTNDDGSDQAGCFEVVNNGLNFRQFGHF